MGSGDDRTRSGLSDAAGRAMFVPVRAAARAVRSQLGEAADDVLSAPEVAHAIDRALEGPLPEELARSLARHRVFDRIVHELAASGELDRMLHAALASPRTQELTRKAVASEETQRVLTEVASSPAVREALERQATGFADELVTGLRAAGARTDDRAEGVVRRHARPERPPYAGIATRALALLTDALLTCLLAAMIEGGVSLIGSMVGGLRPDWLVGVVLGGAWIFVAVGYFVFFWSAAGQTPGMRLLGLRLRVDGSEGAPSPGRSLVRLVGLVLAIIPLFAGFLPVLFDRRRRGLPDYLARTVVEYRQPA